MEMENVDLEEIGRFLKHFDPDVILSDDGDASLLPLLFSLEREDGKPPSPGIGSLIPSRGRSIRKAFPTSPMAGPTTGPLPISFSEDGTSIVETPSSMENREWKG